MKQYWQVVLGKRSVYAVENVENGFIGVDFISHIDISDQLTEDFKLFQDWFNPVYQVLHPDKSKIAIGLAGSMLWKLALGIQVGDIVISPNRSGTLHVGTIIGGYIYEPDNSLPHRRAVEWSEKLITREDMSEALQNSIRSHLTVINITPHEEEIKRLVGGITTPSNLVIGEDAVEDVSAFAMETHLEHFLVENWSQTELGHDYDIYEEDGELIGQQYPTDTGPLDILAISKDKQTLLVVELKKGRASDRVVGQIQRYMGYVLTELAEDHQTVRGVIIAFEDDLRIRQALKVAPNIDFYRYQISFKLEKA